MLPEGVLSIAIRADFWQPQKNERKAELKLFLTVWTYRYRKSCIQPCHSHFTVIPKRPKMCRNSSCNSSLSHFLFPRDFSGTIEDTDIINTPLEPLWPANVPFGGFVDIAPHFGGEIPPKPNFGGVNRRFQAKLAKYWKFHVIETNDRCQPNFAQR